MKKVVQRFISTIYFNLGVALKTSCRIRNARDMLERAIELYPEYRKAILLLAQLYKKEGKG